MASCVGAVLSRGRLLEQLPRQILPVRVVFPLQLLVDLVVVFVVQALPEDLAVLSRMLDHPVVGANRIEVVIRRGTLERGVTAYSKR